MGAGFLTTFLLPLGLFLSTATSLRFPGVPFGISEILLLIVLFVSAPSLIQALKNYKTNLLFHIFWASFFLFGFLGLYCFDLPIVAHQFIEKDILAYGYVFLLSLLFLEKAQQTELVLKTVVILYVASNLLFISYDLFFQVKVFHPYGRFVGLSLNPNQLALTLAPIPFFCLYYAFEASASSKNKVFWALLTLGSFYIGIKNASITILFIWLLFGLSGAILKIMYKKYQKLPFFIFSAFILFSYFSLYYLKAVWSGLIMEFEIRGQLFLKTLQVLQATFFLGNGFGSLVIHEGQAYEPHNTLLNVFLCSGIVPGIIAIILLSITTKKLFKQAGFFITLAFLSVAIFSFAHSLMRHPIFWFYLIACYQMGRAQSKKINQ